MKWQDYVIQMCQLSLEEKNHYDHIIFHKLMTSIKNTNIKNYIFVYWPRENEPETIAIIDELLKRKFKVCLLRINENNDSSFIPITSLDFEYEYYQSIKMPKKSKEISINDIDLVIAPAIMFDNKNRVFIHPSLSLLKTIIDQPSKRRIYRIALSYDFCQMDGTIGGKYIIFDRIITNKKEREE